MARETTVHTRYEVGNRVVGLKDAFETLSAALEYADPGDEVHDRMARPGRICLWRRGASGSLDDAVPLAEKVGR